MRSIDSYNPKSGCGDQKVSKVKAQSLARAFTLLISISTMLSSAVMAATEFSSFSTSSGEQVFSSEGGSNSSGAERSQESAPKSEEQQPAQDENSNIDRCIPGREKRAYSKEAIGYFNRGVELQNSGAFKKAIEQYRLAINSDDRLEEAYSNLGSIYFEMKNFSAAVKAFQAALVLNPNRPKTLNALGAAFSQNGRMAEAQQAWKKALAIDPKFAAVYYNIAVLLEAKKDYQDARNAYFTAFELDSSLTDAKERMKGLPKVKGQETEAHSLLANSISPPPKVSSGQASGAHEVSNRVGPARELRASSPALLELATYSRAVESTKPLPVPELVQPVIAGQQVLFCSPGDDPTRLAIPESSNRHYLKQLGSSMEFSSGQGVGFEATKKATGAQPVKMVASKRQAQQSSIREVKLAKPMLAMKPIVRQQAQIVANSDLASERDLGMVIRLPQAE